MERSKLARIRSLKCRKHEIYVAESFVCNNYGVAGEDFGPRKAIQQLKEGLKLVKDGQKKVTKTTDTFTFYQKKVTKTTDTFTFY